jgi:hypothetical protein
LKHETSASLVKIMNSCLLPDQPQASVLTSVEQPVFVFTPCVQARGESSARSAPSSEQILLLDPATIAAVPSRNKR